MGRIAAPYGVRGWIKVQPYTEALDALLAYGDWWIGDESQQPVPRRVAEARVHSDHVVAKLEGIESRETAARFRGREVAVPREALPHIEDNEVYVGDLVGLEVVNRAGEVLGTVADISDNGAQPVMNVVAKDGVARLIPFVAAVVDEVDLEASRVIVDWQTDY